MAWHTLGTICIEGILDVPLESWLKSFCYKVGCTLNICSIPSSSSSESPTPGSLQGSLDSAVYLTLLWNLYHHLCIVAAQDLGWIKKSFLGNKSQNVSKEEICLILTG